MNLNKAIVVGRLTRDPETKALPSGQSVSTFGLATNRVWTGQDGNKQEATEFHNIVTFGKLADICSNYLSKGRLILIEGRIQTRSWEGQDGQKKYRTEIVADNMQMGPRSGSSEIRDQAPKQTNTNQTPPAQEEIPVIEVEEPIKNESVDVKDIPF
ncbi:MAG: single-stranded DNA-binding protein [Candidatus Portnoybacteria bacterium]|nr:single-stranded DNA-binding protein [Candidatus Portnoybacteria bacterium]